jgi:hypothetical protein
MGGVIAIPVVDALCACSGIARSATGVLTAAEGAIELLPVDVCAITGELNTMSRIPATCILQEYDIGLSPFALVIPISSPKECLIKWEHLTRIF